MITRRYESLKSDASPRQRPPSPNYEDSMELEIIDLEFRLESCEHDSWDYYFQISLSDDRVD